MHKTVSEHVVTVTVTRSQCQREQRSLHTSLGRAVVGVLERLHLLGQELPHVRPDLVREPTVELRHLPVFSAYISAFHLYYK